MKMKLNNHVFNCSVLLILAVVFTPIIMSCSNPEKDFEKAKIENTIEIFEDYINKYPESYHIDEAKNMILDIALNNALGENTNKAFNDFISKYNPNNDYILKINERIKKKEEYLQIAIETFKLAQQETDDENKKQLFKKSEELFYKANFKEAMLDISSFPLLNFHLGNDSKLTKVIDRSFTLTQYIYGSSTNKYEYLVKDEQLNTYTIYNLILASYGRTDFLIKMILKRSGKELEICKTKFSISSNKYTGFSGLIKNKKFDLKNGDKIVLKIIASGDNYGLSCGNFKSYIRILKPNYNILDAVLSERVWAISWSISNRKHYYPTSLLLNFIAQIDHCLLENKNCDWLLGWGNMKNNLPYKANWHNGVFTRNIITMEQAQDLGIKKYNFSYSFSQNVE